MPRKPKSSNTPPLPAQEGAQLLGQNIAIARKRRRLAQRDLATKAGISYTTLRAVEAGSLQTGIGAYLAALWAMGMESTFSSLASPHEDEEGRQLEISRLPQRIRQRDENHEDYF